MSFHPCVSGCGRYLAPGDGHDRCLSCLGIKHAEAAFVDESCSQCGPDSVSCKGAGCPCLCLDLGLPLAAAGGALLLAVAGLVLRWRWGIPLQGTNLRGLLFPPALRSLWSCRRNWLDPLVGYHWYPLVLPPTIGCRSLHRRVSQTCLEIMIRHRYHLLGGQRCRIRIQRWWLCLPGPPKGSGSSGNLHRVPNPLGWTIGFSGWLALVLRAPPRYLSSRKCMMSSLDRGRHLSLPETVPVARPPSPPSTVGQRGGIWRSRRWSGRLRCNCVQIPRPLGVEIRCSPPGPVGTRRPWPAVLMRPVVKLLPPYTLWRCCRFIRPRHWGTCTRVGTTQKFSKSIVPLLTSRYERRRSLRGLWAVRCPLWWSRNAISGCVWLTWGSLTRCGSWMPLCPRPAFSATQWRTSPSSSPLHRSRLRPSGTSCPGVQLLPPPGRRWQRLSLLVAEGGPLPPPPLPRSNRSSLQQSSAVEPVAGQPPRPSRSLPNLVASVRARGPETGDPEMEEDALREMVNAPLPPPEEGRVENLLFLFSPPLASRSVVPKNSTKEQFPLSLGPQRGWGVVDEPVLSHTHPLASEQLWAVRECDQSYYSRTLCQDAGKCCAHSDPVSDRHRDARTGSLRSPSLPHRGYVGGSVGATCTVSGSLVSASQSVLLAPSDHQTRLCDSVRPASSQVQGHPLHFSEGGRCSCLARRDRSPPGEGCDRAGSSSRYEDRVLQPLLHCTQKRRWVETNLGSARPEPGPSQASVQDAHAETYLRMHPSPRLVCSDRPEGRVLPCVDPSAPQAIPAVCVRRTGISVQGPALRAVPVAPCLHESCGGSPCSHERTGCSHSQLPRRLAHTGSFGQSDSTPHAGTCSVGVELLEYVQEQDSGPTETISEAPGAYGSYGGSYAVGAASYETASTLASWPNPEVGVATRHSPGPSHTGLPPNPHPVVRPFVPSGRSAPGTGLQACCGLHGCLHHWLGCHVQRACSVGGLDGPPTALAHQLPRVAGSTPGLDPPQEPPTRRARTGPHGQHCDRCVHQPTRWSTLPSHVATRPPTSSSGVRSIWGRFVPFTFRACSTRQPTSCHELRSPESGDSIPRRSSWCGDVSGQLR